MSARQRARWTVKRSDRHPDHWEAYHPSYGTYWLPDTSGGVYNALTGSKMLPAARAVIDKHFREWSHELTLARTAEGKK